jgi:hypothetical protein
MVADLLPRAEPVLTSWQVGVFESASTAVTGADEHTSSE